MADPKRIELTGMAKPDTDFSKFGDPIRKDANAGVDFSQYGAPVGPRKPTGTEMAGAAGEQAVRGGLISAGVAGGAMTGAGLGMMAAPIAGPAAPVIGGLAGAAYGAWAGETAASGFGIQPVEQLQPGLRPAGYFGEAVGGAAAFAAGPYAAARAGYRFGESMVGNLMNTIIDTAKASPLKFGLAEATSAISAGGGAALAEAGAPGKTGIRVTTETLGGMFNPTRLTMDAATYVGGMAKRGLESFSPAARETSAARTLQELFKVTGEDPVIIARILREQGVVGSDKLTAAQKTGSMALGALEDWLAKSSAQFGAESQQKARDGLDAIRGQITLLSNTGDPAALAAAAQARTVYFRNLITARMDGALQDAQKAAAKITSDTPEARAQLSVIARDALSKSISDSRAAEKELWNKVDGSRKVGFENLQSTFDEKVAELLPEVRNQKLPTIVEQFLTRVSAAKEPTKSLIILPENMTRAGAAPEVVGTTVKEMRQLRSELLDLSRTSTNAGEFGQAKIYSDLAESVLDDMDKAFVQAGDTAYDAARTFSREFNDTFTRSFAGKVMASGRYGDRMAPELTLRKALATGKEAGAIQLEELEAATRFMVTRGLADDTNVRNMLDAQERIIRLAASDTVNPLTGKVDPTRVSKFIKDNEILMKRFPEIKNDLTLAVTSEQAARRMESLAKGQIDVIDKQKAYGRMLASDPVEMASKALISTNQEQQLTNLINIAKAGYTPRGGVPGLKPAEALDGFRASVYDAAIRRGTDKNGVMNIAQTKSLLFVPSVPGQKSPIQVMQDAGVVDAKHVANLKKMFDTAEAITRSQTAGTAIDIKTDITDAAMVTISRVMGSAIAGKTAKMAGSTSPSLIIHGAGARLAETVMTKLPTQSAQKFLIEAANDPQKLAMLLEKVTDPAKQAAQARQIHAWLVQSNLMSAQNLVAPTYEEQPEQAPFFTQPR